METTQVPLLSLQERVHNGLSILDKQFPGWPSRFNGEVEMDVRYGHRCPLSIASGMSYWDARQMVIGQREPIGHDYWGYQHGFHHAPDLAWQQVQADYSQLQPAWEQAITERMQNREEQGQNSL